MCCRAVVGALDVFDDLLAGALGYLSHRPLLSDYDEPETLSYQNALFGQIGTDVRQMVQHYTRANRQKLGARTAQAKRATFGVARTREEN